MSDLPPAGWYDDPENPAVYRYWDGTVWTDHRSPRTPPPGAGGGTSPWQLVPDAFNLLGRHWRVLIAIALPFIALSVIALGLFYLGAGGAFEPDIDEIIDRFTDPGFDPTNDPEDDAFVDSIEFHPNAAVILVWLVGGLAWLLATMLGPVTMTVYLLGARAGRAPPVGETYRRSLRRLPRIIGVALLWTLAYFATIIGVVVVLVVSTLITPFTLLVTIPAIVAAVIWLWPVATLAFTALVATPRGTPPARTAFNLVRGRWAPTAGRVLILALVMFGVGIGTNFVVAPAVLVSLWAGIVVSMVVQLAQYAVGIAGALEIYDWVGGPVDPALTE